MSRLRDRLYQQYLSTHFASSHRLSEGEYESYRIHYREAFLPLLPPDRSAPILDVGCGAGHFLSFLKQEGFTAHAGIDISAEQVNWCREHVTPNVEVVSDSVQYLRARPGRFKAIVSLDVLEHLEEDELLDLLEAVLQALAPDGVFIAKVPNAACLTALMTRYGDLTHCRLFTEGSLRQLFLAAGFADIRVLPNEKRVFHDFRHRGQYWLWVVRDRAIRWWMAKCYEHLMEGAIPAIQTINLLAVGRPATAPKP